MSKHYIFEQSHKKDWGGLQSEMDRFLMDLHYKSNLGSFKKDFEVEIRECKQSKTIPQLRGIYKLCTLLIPHLRARDELDYTLEDVKREIKYELGYMRPPTPIEVAFMIKTAQNIGGKRGVKFSLSDIKQFTIFAQAQKQPKSFADASKEEMEKLITQIEVWAAEQGFEGVFLN